MKLDNKQVKIAAKNITLVVIGTLILAFGTAIFILPFDLVVGGISGAAILIKSLIPSDKITIDLIVTVLTWLTFFLGLIFLGKRFAMKTLVSTIVYPLGISLFLLLTKPSVMGGFLDLTKSAHGEIALIIAALVGGAFIGVGCAVTFLGGGSTGGVDILAFIICKFVKKLKVSQVIFCLDGLVIVLGVFVSKDLVLSLLGIFSSLLSNLLIDKVFLGGGKACAAQIITTKPQEITRLVIEKLERTTTIAPVTGGYTGEQKSMVMVTFSMRQYAELVSIVNECDGLAFITIHKAHEIYGQDWTR